MTTDLHTAIEVRLSEVAGELSVKLKERDILDAKIAVLREEQGHLQGLVSLSDSGPKVSPAGLVSLDVLEVTETRQRPPIELFLPSGLVRPLPNWYSLLTEVAVHLVQQGQITATHCPIRLPRSRKEILIGTSPQHVSGPFRSAVEIGPGLWLEKWGDAAELLEKTRFLIQNTGGEVQAYKLRLS